jgi:hypothetical protein
VILDEKKQQIKQTLVQDFD